MLANILTAVLSLLVVAGVLLQFAAASGLGVRIMRQKLVRRVPPAPIPHAAVAAPKPRPAARRRCREYRAALRAARASVA